jgi:hypothetical protein
MTRSSLVFDEIRRIFAQICTGVTSSPKFRDKLSWNNCSRLLVGTWKGCLNGSLDMPELIIVAAVLKTW